MPEKNGNKFPKTRPGYINALFKVEKNQCSFTIKKNRLKKKLYKLTIRCPGIILET